MKVVFKHYGSRRLQNQFEIVQVQATRGSRYQESTVWHIYFLKVFYKDPSSRPRFEIFLFLYC